MKTKECTTHHYACDCREERYDKLEQLFELYEEALKDISNQDFRGNRPWGATRAYEALNEAERIKSK